MLTIPLVILIVFSGCSSNKTSSVETPETPETPGPENVKNVVSRGSLNDIRVLFREIELLLVPVAANVWRLDPQETKKLQTEFNSGYSAAVDFLEKNLSKKENDSVT